MRVLVLLALASAVHAEGWPPLHDYVRGCSLIVKAKASVPAKGPIRFEVLETWRGRWNPSAFGEGNVDESGHYLSRAGEHGVDVKDGQEIVIFFSKPGKGEKLGRHTTAFPIVKKRVLYAETSDDDQLRRWWPVWKFEERIRALRLPMAKSGEFILQCLKAEKIGDQYRTTFLMEPWHPTTHLFAEAGSSAEGEMIWRHPSGRIEITSERPVRVVKVDILRVVKSKWNPSEGPFTVEIHRKEKSGVQIGVSVARKRLLRETDPIWLLAALQVVDAKWRRLESRSLAANHRGGGATFERDDGTPIAYPVRVSYPVPLEVKRETLTFAFPK
ncbi:MAG: hypothetical protein AAGD14_02035 [Planctomycetota bacterium]